MNISVKNVTIKKTARYFMLGQPTSLIRQVWFVCHGYGFLAGDFLENFRQLDDGTRLVVAPEGLHRFYLFGTNGKVGASWMTKEDRLNDIHDNINYLDDVYADVMGQLNGDSVKITILGFSQGTATACRWALGGKSPAHRLILWGGDFPSDTGWDAVRQRLDSLDIHLVVGNMDPYMKSELLQRQKIMLAKNNVDYRLTIFDGHHEIDVETLAALARLPFK